MKQCLLSVFLPGAFAVVPAVRCSDWGTFNGILHIEGGDAGAAFSATSFVYVVNHLLYARHYNLLPFVHFDPKLAYTMYDPVVHGVEVRDVPVPVFSDPRPPGLSMGPLTRNESLGNVWTTFSPSWRLLGNGIWDTYFEPVSSFSESALQECLRSSVPMPRLVQLSDAQRWTMHLASPWAAHAWPYGDASFCRGVCGSDTVLCNSCVGALPSRIYEYDNTWVYRQRRAAAAVASSHIHVRNEVRTRVALFRKNVFLQVKQRSNSPIFTLCMHMRGTDKATSGFRQRGSPQLFLNYATAFMEGVLRNKSAIGVIFLATDDGRLARLAHSEWPVRNSLYSFAKSSLLSDSSSPTFTKYSSQLHRINVEVLTDILLLSQCDFLLHAHSSVSESAIYLNVDLHNRSVDLDYAVRRVTCSEFADEVAEYVMQYVSKADTIMSDPQRIRTATSFMPTHHHVFAVVVLCCAVVFFLFLLRKRLRLTFKPTYPLEH